MEGILSPSDNKDSTPPPSLPPRFDGDSGGGKRSRKTSTGDGTGIVTDKRESDSVRKKCITVVFLLLMKFLGFFFVESF